MCDRPTAVYTAVKRFRRWLGPVLIGFLATAATAQETVIFELLAEYERPGRQPLGGLVRHPDGMFFGTTVAGGTWDRGTVFQVTPEGGRTTLHALAEDEGAAPVAGLVLGPDGALFGTTTEGGVHGFGTVFRITPSGVFTTLIHFTGPEGVAPGSVPGELMLHSDGLLYGTTGAGGVDGWGTVYSLTAGGVLTTMITFSGIDGSQPGSEPRGPLVGAGNVLYGITRSGGAGGVGTVFRVTTAGTGTILREFSGGDGRNPAGGLILHSDGLLYGTTEFGGNTGVGVAFRVDPGPSGGFMLLHHFSDRMGSQPTGTLVLEDSGSLLGVASVGGQDGWGGLFRLATSGAYELLFSFTGSAGAYPGASPRSGLVAAPDGRFVGVASAGGAGQRGVVYRIDPDGTYAELSDFSPRRGWAPSGAPVPGGEGQTLFPMAEGGSVGYGLIAGIGADGALRTVQDLTPLSGGRVTGPLVAMASGWLGLAGEGGASDHGTIVHIDPPNPPLALVDLNTSVGEGFRGPLTEGASGIFYGVALRTGLFGQGGVFRIDQVGGIESVFQFTGLAGEKPGSRPQAPLARGLDGSLFGVTEAGGAADQGVIFRIAPDGAFSILAEFAPTGPRRPRGGLTSTLDGRIFGTTSLGGPADAGTVIELNPVDGSWETVAAFSGLEGSLPGSMPIGSLSLGGSGRLYGVTSNGPGGWGTAFSITPDIGGECLVVFTGVAGAFPGTVTTHPEAQVEWIGGLNEGADGAIYGVTPGGGSGGGGTVFRLRSNLTLEAWKQANLGDSAAPDLGDPDRDGLSNLLEYALQGSPVTPDTSPVQSEVRFNAGVSYLGLSLTRDPARSDISLTVESAPSPAGPWAKVAESRSGAPFSGTGLIEEVADGFGAWNVLVFDSEPTAIESSRFMRIVVTH